MYVYGCHLIILTLTNLYTKIQILKTCTKMYTYMKLLIFQHHMLVLQIQSLFHAKKCHWEVHFYRKIPHNDSNFSKPVGKTDRWDSVSIWVPTFCVSRPFGLALTYFIQHSVICCPSDSTLWISEDAAIEPRKGSRIHRSLTWGIKS